MTNTQLYLAIGIPLIVSTIGFTMVGIMLLWLKGDIREIREDIKLLTGKVVEIMIKIEHM